MPPGSTSRIKTKGRVPTGPLPLALARFSAAPSCLAAIVEWQAWLTAEKRASPHTIAAYGSDLAGVINHNVDKNIVAVADGTYLVRWLSVVARGIPDMAALKGKRVAVSKGTGGEIFWNRVVDKLKLDTADYKIVDIEAPEMVAALERRPPTETV